MNLIAQIHNRDDADAQLREKETNKQKAIKEAKGNPI